VVHGLWHTKQNNEDVLKQSYVVNPMLRYLTNILNPNDIQNQEELMGPKQEENLMEYIW
jgi:hypothetical protein